MNSDTVHLTPISAQRLRVSLAVGMAFVGVVSLYWVGLAAANSMDSTFVAQSDRLMAAVQLGGGLMLLIGLGSSIVHPDRVVGLLATGLGITWLAPEVAGWVEGPQWIRSGAFALSLMFVPLFLHLGLAYPIGRTGNRWDRRLIAVAYAAGIIVTSAVAVLYQPFLDLYCWRTCSASPYVLVGDPGLSRSMIRIAMWTMVALSTAFAWRASARGFSKPSRGGAATSWWVLGPVILLALTQASYFVVLLARRTVDPSDPVLSSLMLVGGVLLTVLGLGMAWDLVRDVRLRGSLAELLSELEAGTSGPLASVLTNSLGDPSVEVAYWIPSLQRYVDSEGRDVAPTLGPGRAVATLERAGVELGKVLHASRLSDADLESEIGSAARLAVDNERLRAELLAQANEIRASQERIVAAGDTARRRLERDLHDGAQQSLLALSYKLRTAATKAQQAGADERALALGEANGDVLTTIDEVRRLAHGIFPSILVDAGLVRALQALREESTVQIEIDLSDSACGESTGMAIYQLVAATLDAPAIDEDARISITGEAVDDRLIVDVTVEAPVAVSALVHALDRIGAIGGTVSFMETGMHVVVPCA